MNQFYLTLAAVLLFTSCTKENTQPENRAQIDYVVFIDDYFNTADTLKNILYDANGRLVQFGNDSYSYTGGNKPNHVIEKLDFSNIPSSVTELSYDLSYDGKGRLTEVSDAKYDGPSSGLSSTPFAKRTSYRLTYEGDSQLPLTRSQSYYSVMFGDDFLTQSSTLSDFTQTSKWVVQQNNIVERITTNRGKKGDRWKPGPPEDFEIITNTSFMYDNKPNVFQYLFGSLGFIPEPVLDFSVLEHSFFYSKNNPVKITNGAKSISIIYNYDEKGRIQEIRPSGTRRMTVFYKD